MRALQVEHWAAVLFLSGGISLLVVVIAIGIWAPQAIYMQLITGLASTILFASALVLIWRNTSIRSKLENTSTLLHQVGRRKYELGRPYKKKKGIFYYKRQDLPAITELICRAQRAIVFVEVTGRGFFEILDSEGPTITEEKKILAWLFPSDSEILQRHSEELGLPDLTEQAAQSLEILKRVRDRIPNKQNLEIRILNSYLNHSMIIIDPGDINSMMEIVEYNARKPIDEWSAKLIFKCDNPGEYERYFLEYQKVIEDSWKDGESGESG